MGDRRWPTALQPGDTVAVVAPSGPCDAERLAAGVAVIQSWGLRVRYTPHTWGRHPRLRYLAADDATRAADLTAAWVDPGARAVWAARGGYGAQRMVDLVDYGALRSAGPKHLIGFSDITALHSRIGRELGQVTLHGPVAGSVQQLADGPTVDALRRLLTGRPAPGRLLGSAPHAVVEGTATGRLWGGNLSLLASDVGVEPPPDEPVVMVCEDVEESGYRVDRMLTQLARSGWLAAVVGVVVGEFTGRDGPEVVSAVVADRLAGLRVPVLAGFGVGHGARNLPVPLGARVRLDVGAAGGHLTLM